MPSIGRFVWKIFFTFKSFPNSPARLADIFFRVGVPCRWQLGLDGGEQRNVDRRGHSGRRQRRLRAQLDGQLRGATDLRPRLWYYLALICVEFWLFTAKRKTSAEVVAAFGTRWLTVCPFSDSFFNGFVAWGWVFGPYVFLLLSRTSCPSNQ